MHEIKVILDTEDYNILKQDARSNNRSIRSEAAYRVLNWNDPFTGKEPRFNRPKKISTGVYNEKTGKFD